MAFQSTLRMGEHLIGDDNFGDYIGDGLASEEGGEGGFGYIPRDFAAMPYGSQPFAAKFDAPLIPESEWTERIEEMERKKTRLSDIVLAKKIPSTNQSSTNFCWAFSQITAMLTLRAVMNEPFVMLSGASVAAPIKNFRNQGGWGTQALKHIVQFGAASTEFWPQAANSRQYYTEEAKANALLHRVTEWWDIPAGSFAHVMTCVLNRWPISLGLSWWGHQVTGMDGVVISPGRYGIRIRNSWGDSWGSKGFSVLTRSKSTPDDASAPRVTLPSDI